MVGHPQVQLATTRTCETCSAYCCAFGSPCAINHCNNVRSASVSGLSSGRGPITDSDLWLSIIPKSIGQNPDQRGYRTIPFSACRRRPLQRRLRKAAELQNTKLCATGATTPHRLKPVPRKPEMGHPAAQDGASGVPGAGTGGTYIRKTKQLKTGVTCARSGGIRVEGRDEIIFAGHGGFGGRR